MCEVRACACAPLYTHASVSEGVCVCVKKEGNRGEEAVEAAYRQRL